MTGVELSTTHKDKEVHVLGYFPDEPTESFKDMLAEMSMLRIGRMKRMIAKLNALGCPIEEEYVFSLPAGGIIGRAHLFRAIRDRFSGEFNARADKWLNIGGCGVRTYVRYVSGRCHILYSRLKGCRCVGSSRHIGRGPFP